MTMMTAVDLKLALRPQPLGVFTGPQGALLLPSLDDADLQARALAGVMRGRTDNLPEPWQFYALAIHDEQAAYVALQGDDSLEARFNRFVVNPSLEDYANLQAQLTGEVLDLLEAVAFQLGYRDTPPEPQAAEAEVKAYLLATQAHHLLATGDGQAGMNRLEQAANLAKDSSPTFAARLYGEWASLESMAGPLSHKGLGYFETALELFEDTNFNDARAELWLHFGIACQDRAEGSKGWLLKAVNAYQEALKVLTKTHLTHSYGLAQMNLALCYLNMPMNDEADKLRPAIAVQSLRGALEVFTQEGQPEMWASATLNLANALQHAKTSHPEDNLWEAVALYEDVLTVRNQDSDALGYARVLANQGNALAHLGAFSRAVPRLQQAQDLFAGARDDVAVATLETILEDIHARKQAGS